jgi:4-amino-4-deoxy-L-arabinose transferase-like glycosyltransferase
VTAALAGATVGEGRASIWERLRVRPWLVAVLLGLAGLLLVSVGFWRAGIAWDEPHTIIPGTSYVEWIFGLPKTFSWQSIDHYWSLNYQHPPLTKVLMGFVIYLAGPFAQPLFAARVVSVLAFGLTAALLYLFLRREVNGRVALFGTIAFLLLPRVTAEAQFATLDSMMMLTWFLASWAFYRGMREPRGALWFGLAYGLALLTKLNSFYLPFLLFAWAILQMGRRMETIIILGGLIIAAGLTALGWGTPTWVSLVGLAAVVGLRLAVGRRLFDLNGRTGLAFFILTVAFLVRGLGGLGAWYLPRLTQVSAGPMLLGFLPVTAVGVWVILRRVKPGTALANLVALFTISPVVFLVGWPWLWPQPVSRFAQYLTYHGAGVLVSWIDPTYVQYYAQRILIPVYYLRTAYVDVVAPWHYPWVLVLATTPLLLAWPLLTGLLRTLRRSLGDACSGFLIVQALGILLVHSLPWVPKYDGVRLFLPVFPFLAACMGVGIDRFCARRRLYDADGPFGWWVVLGALLLLQASVAVFRPPLGSTYYSLVVAGGRGARYLGLETSYWGEGFDWKMIRTLNSRLPVGGRVIFVAVGEFVPDLLKAMGELPKDMEVVPLQAVRDGGADFAVVAEREGWLLKEGLNPEFVDRLAPIESTRTSTAIICRLLNAKLLLGGVQPPVTGKGS